MKKLLLVFIFSGLAVPAHAADMAQKFGAGVRGGNFNLRYFLSNSFCTETVLAYRSTKNDNAADTSLYYFGGGAFYNREVHKDIMLQAGALVAYSTGMDSEKVYGQWYLAPFAGAEVIINDRFGIDFRVHPAEVALYTTGGAEKKTVWSLYSSLGAHYYF